MRILCGITDRTVTDQSLQVGHVKQYWKHPKYSQQTIDYDLCLFGKNTNDKKTYFNSNAVVIIFLFFRENSLLIKIIITYYDF